MSTEQRSEPATGTAPSTGSAPSAEGLTIDTTHYRTCPLCEAMCGLEIAAAEDRVVRVRGDRLDPFSAGFLCPKGAALGHLHHDPDRLRRPMVRDGDDPDTATWREVDWDEAFAEVERRLGAVLGDGTRDTVAVYLGNPNVHNPSSAIYIRPLVKALATTNVYSASTVDQMPRHVSCGLMYGNPDTIPVPDLDRTSFLLMLGANPLESNGSLCTAADFPGRLAALRDRGGRLVVVDPRRTKSAAAADEHLFIRPGTDAAFLLSILSVLVEDGLVDLGQVAAHVTGLDEVCAAVRDWLPERTEHITGITASTTRRLAHELATADRAAVYGRMGTTTVPFGTLTSWAADLCTILTGNLDRPGGLMFPLAAHTSRRRPGPGRGFRTGRRHSRVRGYPEARGEFPVATLADEILTPGAGQVRALVTVAGNPVLSTPDSGRLEEALGTLDAMVCVDPYLNETTRFAHVILPPPGPLERSHYDLAFTTLAVRNTVKWSPPMFPPDGPGEEVILAKLALIAAGAGADADPAVIDDLVLSSLLDRAVGDGGPLQGADPADLRRQLVATTPVEQALEVMVRLGAYGDRFGTEPDGLTFERLADEVHGIDLGPLESRVPEVVSTTTGAIELAPPAILADVARLATSIEDLAGNGLVLVGRRHLRSNNSWMHNVPVLVKGRHRCTLQIHPDDATARHLTDGDLAEIRSRAGAVQVAVEVTDEIMAGVVSLPHGWGHDRPGIALAVASSRPGVNSNVLTDADRTDHLSGNAVLNGIPVEVTAVDPQLAGRGSVDR
ncbi:MAG: molybdopterin oxidoreductase family protein [Acidimicrobiia bacterium]|nr:molybdopterin oxidoreductase family protein [Acidimicrobiia bacterium]